MGTGYFAFDCIVLLLLMPALRATFTYADRGARAAIEIEGICASLGVIAAMYLVAHHAMLTLQGAP